MRDVIERPISDELDISGWDLTKALALFRKSNPPLLEWLQSPIIYHMNAGFHAGICELMPQYFSPIGAMYHYRRMTERTCADYLGKPSIKLKKYFYALRPILACMWIEHKEGIPPMEFGKLINELLPCGDVREAIDDLLAWKTRSNESQQGPSIPVIDTFITTKLKSLSEATCDVQFTKSWDPLDEFFRQLLIQNS